MFIVRLLIQPCMIWPNRSSSALNEQMRFECSSDSECELPERKKKVVCSSLQHSSHNNANQCENPANTTELTFNQVYTWKELNPALKNLLPPDDEFSYVVTDFTSLSTESFPGAPKSSILGCLTDLVNWHYIKLTRNRDTCKLEVTSYSKQTMTLPPTEMELSSHLLFLLQCQK